MLTNKCDCNIGSAYCYDLYGCLGENLILKAGLLPAGVYDVYIEDHFGNLFKQSGLIADIDGNLTIPVAPNDSWKFIISEVSENLLLYICSVGTTDIVKLSLGTDGETYDGVLLKFHGGDAAINTIQ